MSYHIAVLMAERWDQAGSGVPSTDLNGRPSRDSPSDGWRVHNTLDPPQGVREDRRHNVRGSFWDKAVTSLTTEAWSMVEVQFFPRCWHDWRKKCLIHELSHLDIIWIWRECTLQIAKNRLSPSVNCSSDSDHVGHLGDVVSKSPSERIPKQSYSKAWPNMAQWYLSDIYIWSNWNITTSYYTLSSMLIPGNRGLWVT